MSSCRVCQQKIVEFFSLGRMPLVNRFLKKEDLLKEKKFDLSIGFCPDCYLVQLTKTVDLQELFRDYIYFSSTSQTIVNHSRETAHYLTKRLGLSPQSLVLEIGSNDGVQLEFFKKLGIGILGIDPARNVAKIANQQGIKTIAGFFNYTFAQKLVVSQGIKADLIFGANVFAHVPEIVDFVKGVKVILKPKGTAVFEFPYLKGLMENKFDTIYHEHVFYYSMLSLRNLFQKAGLEVYDVEQIKAQGGSLRIFVCHPSNYQLSKRVKNLEKEELKQGFDKIETYQAMKKRINLLKKDLINLLKKLKKKGKKIAAYSAPAKGNVLLNYFGISTYLDFIVDKSKAKQGLYTPGTHLLVYPPEKIKKKKPDYLLILCWNIKEEIIREYEWYRNQGGKFIIPIPQMKII